MESIELESCAVYWDYIVSLALIFFILSLGHDVCCPDRNSQQMYRAYSWCQLDSVSLLLEWLSSFLEILAHDPPTRRGQHYAPIKVVCLGRLIACRTHKTSTVLRYHRYAIYVYTWSLSLGVSQTFESGSPHRKRNSPRDLLFLHYCYLYLYYSCYCCFSYYYLMRV